jgi:hypothetical protein
MPGSRSDARGGTYYRKKIAEGKSRREALRCLKKEAHLGCRLQEPHGRFAGTLARRRLTKRSRERRQREVVRRILQNANFALTGFSELRPGLEFS